MHLRRAGQHRDERIRHRLVNVVIHLDLVRGLSCMESRICHHERENIADAARCFAGRQENRQVRNRKARAALARNISRGEDSFHARHRLRNRSVDPENFRPRVRTQQRRAVQHPRCAHIVHEGFLAQRLLHAEISRWRPSDPIRMLPKCGVPAHSVLFAEVAMSPRFVARQLLMVVPGLARRLNGVDDPRVPSAAAKVRVQRLRDGLAILGVVVFEQPRRAHHNSRNTKPALHRAFHQEGLA